MESIEYTAKEIITQVLVPDEVDVSEDLFEDLCDILSNGVY